MGFVGKANSHILSKKYNVKDYDIKYDRETPRLYESDIFIICVPTDGVNGRLDGSIVDNCIKEILSRKKDAEIVIRSTVTIGFTDSMRKKHGTDKIYFVPEFLREGKNIYDACNPSRIIAPEKWITDLFLDVSENNPPVLICSNSEAEAIKLYSNTFLACRVAIFNEIDSECLNKNLDAQKVIKGMCLDNRIGDYYNNPSFGFGGYCLPKDSEEVKNISDGVILRSITESNKQRKLFIAGYIDKNFKGKTVVISNTAMKSGSSNPKCSAVLDIAEMIKNNDVKIFDDAVVLNNRLDNIFSRDIFGRD